MAEGSLSHYFNTQGGDRHLYFRTRLPSVPLVELGRASDEEVGDVWAYPAGEEWECGMCRGTR
jgi:hypothetical protein